MSGYERWVTMGKDDRTWGRSIGGPEFDGGDRHTGPVPEGSDPDANPMSTTERPANLRYIDGHAPPRLDRRSREAGASPPPAIPGWRFVDDGAAIAFSDGRSWRRTIVLPTILDEDSAHGFKRTLSALRGLGRSKRQAANSLDDLRRLLLLLVATTEYRELLHQAALDKFGAPLIVEHDVRLELRRKAAGPFRDRLRVMDEGDLRVDLDTVTFTGTHHIHRVAVGHASNVNADIGLGHVSFGLTGAQRWHLQGVSPVGVCAAASACRMTAADSRGYRADPAKLAADLLDPNDPGLLAPGDDPVLELEGLCRELGHA